VSVGLSVLKTQVNRFGSMNAGGISISPEEQSRSQRQPSKRLVDYRRNAVSGRAFFSRGSDNRWDTSSARLTTTGWS